MKKMLRLFLAFTLVASYLITLIGLVNAEPRAIPITDENALERIGLFREQPNALAAYAEVETTDIIIGWDPDDGWGTIDVDDPGDDGDIIVIEDDEEDSIVIEEDDSDISVIDDSPSPDSVIADGQFSNQVDGLAGAEWRLHEHGLLEVDSGFIYWIDSYSPWHDYRHQINEIIFTGSLTAGTSLRGLFMNLENVSSISGLEHFNTSSVIYMDSMFSGAINLLELDLRNWDTSSVENMENMFFSTSSLRTLILGENFVFVGNSNLPEILQTDEFSGYWQNVGLGRTDQPLGEHVLTSTQLMNHVPISDTYVWQGRDEEVEEGVILIRTAEELAAIGGPESAGQTFALANNIYLTEPWVPIDGFLGTLNGRGYAINNLFVSAESNMYVGLFGVLGDPENPSRIVIENLRVNIAPQGLNAFSTSALNVGGIAGWLSSGTLEIINSSVHGNITGTSDANVYIGGLLGADGAAGTHTTIFRSYVTGSYETGNITSFTIANEYLDMAGGLVGAIFGSVNISDSFAQSDISSISYAGGLVGLILDANSSIVNSYAAGNVTAGRQAGGLVGQANTFGEADIINSYRLTTQNVIAPNINIHGEERTVEQMGNPAYLPGWDFENIWRYPDDRNRFFRLLLPLLRLWGGR